jgi:hypothetical protein
MTIGMMGALMKLRVFVLCAMAALSACHRDSTQTSPVAKLTARVKAPVAPAPGPTAQEQTATMVEAATQGKSQAPVTLKFDLPERPVQGRPLEIAIALLPQIPASPATIEVSGADGLKLADGESPIEFSEVEAAQVYRHNIKLTPTAEGVYMLALNVSLKHDQITDSRIFCVPLIVAAPSNTAPAPQAGGAPQGGGGAAPQQSVAAAQQPKGATP